MPDLLKAPLVLAVFALLSVAVTAVAAGQALERPSLTHLAVDTRSRLAADYSVDALTQRLEPLNPEVIKAAADDEADLMEESSTSRTPEPSPTATQGVVEPSATPTTVPTREPTATATPTARASATASASPTPLSTPRPTSTRTPATITSTPRPSPTATPQTPTPTFTPRPTFTPTPVPTKTPLPTATPLPPTKTPVPTNTPQPTNTPKPGGTPSLCDLLPDPPPYCDVLGLGSDLGSYEWAYWSVSGRQDLRLQDFHF
jgi:hypothetical protein